MVTLPPDETMNVGTGSVVGAATAHSALGDSSDGTYVRVPTQTRNEAVRWKVGFPVPSIPAGARVVSVVAKDRIRSHNLVGTVPGYTGWLGCRRSTGGGGGSTYREYRDLYFPPIPIFSDSQFTDRVVGQRGSTAPDGTPWDAETLGSLFFEIAKADSGPTALDTAKVWLEISYLRQSTVTPTGPLDGSDTNPVVSWTFTSLDNQPQAKRRVVVYPLAATLDPDFEPFDTEPLQYSGSKVGPVADRYWESAEDGRWPLPNALTDGDYKAYIQVTTKWTGAGDFVSDIAAIEWTRDGTPATPPPAAQLLSAQYLPTLGVVQLVVQPSGPTPVTTGFTVRSNTDADTDNFRDVPSAIDVPADGTNPVTIWDSGPDLNEPIRYHVIALNEDVAANDPSNELIVTPISREDWLVDPLNPENSTPILLKAPGSADEGREYELKMSEMIATPVGGAGVKALPRRIIGAYNGEEHKITLRFNGMGEVSMSYWNAVYQLWRSGHVLKWKRPDGSSLWGAISIGTGGQNPKVKEDRVAGNVAVIGWRDFEFSFIELAEPEY